MWRSEEKGFQVEETVLRSQRKCVLGVLRKSQEPELDETTEVMADALDPGRDVGFYSEITSQWRFLSKGVTGSAL